MTVGDQKSVLGSKEQERRQEAERLIELLASVEFTAALRAKGVDSLEELIRGKTISGLVDGTAGEELKPVRPGALQRLRAAGGDAWKRVADPTAYLKGDES